MDSVGQDPPLHRRGSPDQGPLALSEAGRQLADREAIRELAYRYARAVDRRDWALAEHALHRRRGAGRAALRAGRARERSCAGSASVERYRATFHAVQQPDASRSPATRRAVRPTASPTTSSSATAVRCKLDWGIRYQDRCRRGADGAWRLAPPRADRGLGAGARRFRASLRVFREETPMAIDFSFPEDVQHVVARVRQFCQRGGAPRRGEDRGQRREPRGADRADHPHAQAGAGVGPLAAAHARGVRRHGARPRGDGRGRRRRRRRPASARSR